MENKDEDQNNVDNKNPVKQGLRNYTKYTGLAFQMMAVIGLSAFIGYKIDQHYEHQTQWVTAIACVLGVILSIYQIIKQLK